MQTFGNLRRGVLFANIQTHWKVRDENFWYLYLWEMGGEKIDPPAKRSSKMTLRPLSVSWRQPSFPHMQKAEVTFWTRELSFTSLVRPSKCLTGLICPRVRLQTQLNTSVFAWRITVVEFDFPCRCARLRIDRTVPRNESAQHNGTLWICSRWY